MAANTPLRRYKQNTHGGGIRDPLVISWPKGIAARGELRHQFCHASDLAPTLLDVVGVKPPDDDQRRRSRCRSRARASPPASRTPTAPSKAAAAVLRDVRPSRPVQDGWKAVAFHPPGTRLRRGQVGAVPSRPRLQRDRRSRREGAGAAEGDDRRMVDAGRGAQGAAARRPLRAALRRQRQALPRPAQALRLPRRHGPRADRRGARRAQPHLHDRGRRRGSTGRRPRAC